MLKKNEESLVRLRVTDKTWLKRWFATKTRCRCHCRHAMVILLTNPFALGRTRFIGNDTRRIYCCGGGYACACVFCFTRRQLVVDRWGDSFARFVVDRCRECILWRLIQSNTLTQYRVFATCVFRFFRFMHICSWLMFMYDLRVWSRARPRARKWEHPSWQLR